MVNAKRALVAVQAAWVRQWLYGILSDEELMERIPGLTEEEIEAFGK